MDNENPQEPQVRIVCHCYRMFVIIERLTENYEHGTVPFSAVKLKGSLECFSRREGAQELGLNQSALAPSLTCLLKISEREYW